MSHTKKTSKWKNYLPIDDVYKLSVGNFLTRCIFYVLILNTGDQKILFFNQNMKDTK